MGKYQALAIHMQDFVHGYQPSCWIVPIGNVCARHYISSQDAKKFTEFFKEGNLEEKLSNYQNGKFNKKNFQKWYVQEAILAFYQEGKHKEILVRK